MERKIIGGEKNVYIKEIAISAMNRNVRNGWKGDPKFSLE